MPTSRPRMPPAAPVTSDDIEQQFYDALQHADIEALMALWSDDDEIVCVHPGGPRAIGAAAIRASFEAIFANGSIDAHPERVRRMHSAACMLHSVLEHVRVATERGPRSAWVIATNVYVHTPRGWRLAAHHASPGTEAEIREMLEAGSTIH